jgi:N-acetylneuraminic acid mutarotase
VPMFDSRSSLRTRAWLAATGALCLLAAASPLFAAPGVFIPVGSMAKARANHVGILVLDGRVLAIGGSPTSQDTVEQYDPATGQWSGADPLGVPRDLFAAVLLRDGRGLVTGGVDGSGKSQLSCQIYDPVAAKWVPAAAMNQARREHTATLLGDGTVLVAGGIDDGGAVLATSELYDPVSNKWTFTAGAMSFARARHAAAAFRDGRVVVAGGINAALADQATTEIYNAGTGFWTRIGDMGRPRANHSATMLPDGRVLAVGGNMDGTSELLSGASWSFTPGGMPGGFRILHTTTLVPRGIVWVIGGSDGVGSVAMTALFNPANNLWTTGPNMGTKRQRHSATMMPDGRVLVAGGLDGGGGALDTAELLDVDAPSWTAAASLPAPPVDGTATLLKTGKVLVAGGLGVAEGFVYDPGTTSWTPTSNSMSTTRSRHTATTLVNGQVLVAGSAEGDGKSADLYDPPTDKWTATGPLSAIRSDHTATLLPCGEVLVAGGLSGASVVDTAERYNPRTRQWTPAASLKARRTGHTATLLKDGSVLVTGGRDGGGPVNSAEIYDPAANSWTLLVAPMGQSRDSHTATLLPNGRVLLTGGTAAGTTAEVFDPSAGSFAVTGAPVFERDSGFTATLLPNGRVLVAGGLKFPTRTETYDPVTLTWTAGPDTLLGHARHPASLTGDGRVVVAGSTGASPTSAEYSDVGRGEVSGWRPQLSAISDPLVQGDRLAANGLLFQGMSEASTGASPRQSSTAYPLVQLRRLDNALVAWLPADPTGAWTDTVFRSQPVTGLAPGLAIATVFTNGIPGASRGLSVECPPAVITTQPASQSVCATDPLTLAVGVSSSFCETYQWYKDSVLVLDGGAFSGATTPTLHVSTGAVGVYQAVVSLSCSSAATSSSDALVTLEPALSSVTATMPVGTSVCATCLGGTATESHVGGGAVGQQWGYRTTSAGPVTALAGRTGPSYTLNGADFPGAGNYFLVVTTTPACGSPLVSNEILVTVTTGGTVQDVQFLTVTSRDAENVLEWINPPSNGTVVVRFSGASTTCAPPATATAGALLISFSATAGVHERIPHPSLVNTTQYCYSVFYDAGGGYGSGRSNNGRPFSTLGAVKWAFNTGVFSTTPPTVGGAGVIVTSNDGVVHALARGLSGGEWAAGWKPFLLGQPAQSRSPVVPITVATKNPVVYLGSQDGRVYALAATDGSPLWITSPLGTIVQAAPAGMFTAFGGAFDYLLVGTRQAGNNLFYALDPLSGATMPPAFDNGGGIGIVSGPATVDYASNRVYFTSRAGTSLHTLWGLDLGSPPFALAWTRDLGDIDSSPVLRGGRIYVGSTAGGGTLHSIDAALGLPASDRAFVHGDGQVKGFVFPDRTSPTGDLYFSTNSRVWVVQDNGSTLSLKYAGGIVLGGGATPSAVLYVPGTGIVYAGGSDGQLYRIDTTGASPVVTAKPLGIGAAVVGAPSLDRDYGLVIVGTEAGIFYAVDATVP